MLTKDFSKGTPPSPPANLRIMIQTGHIYGVPNGIPASFLTKGTMIYPIITSQLLLYVI